MKNKGTACSCKCCGNYIPAVTTCELVVLPSWHCFRNPDALDPPLCLVRIVRQCLRMTLKKLLQDTAWKYGCEYCLTNIARACNFFYDRCVQFALSYTSRAEEVMRECDIHHTRSIKTISSWAASLGWTSAVTCCNLYRGYHVPVVLGVFHHIRHRFCSPHHSNSISYEMQPDPVILFVDASFCSILFRSV